MANFGNSCVRFFLLSLVLLMAILQAVQGRRLLQISPAPEGEPVSSTVGETVSGALDTAGQAAGDALDLASDVVADTVQGRRLLHASPAPEGETGSPTVGETVSDALDTAGQAAGNALDVAGNAASDGLDVAADVIDNIFG